MSRTLLIPAAGSAIRMRGLPKFLLPTPEENVTLIERHIFSLSENFDEILIGINPIFEDLLETVLSENAKIKIHAMTTETMMETVINLAEFASSDSFVLIMPDTYFSNYENILDNLKNSKPENSLALGCWRIRDFQVGKLGQVLLNEKGEVSQIRDKDQGCSFDSFWGMAKFSKLFLDLGDPGDSHIGMLYEKMIKREIKIQAFKIDGHYYDCGTASEYIRMLKENS